MSWVRLMLPLGRPGEDTVLDRADRSSPELRAVGKGGKSSP